MTRHTGCRSFQRTARLHRLMVESEVAVQTVRMRAISGISGHSDLVHPSRSRVSSDRMISGVYPFGGLGEKPQRLTSCVSHQIIAPPARPQKLRIMAAPTQLLWRIQDQLRQEGQIEVSESLVFRSATTYR
jgi:hypothetical protein